MGTTGYLSHRSAPLSSGAFAGKGYSSLVTAPVPPEPVVAPTPVVLAGDPAVLLAPPVPLPVLEVLPVTVVAPPTPVPPVTPAASPAVMPVLPLAALLLESPGPLVSEPSGLEHAPQSASMMMPTEARDSRRVRSGEIRIFCMVLPLPVNGGPATCRNAEFERSTTHGK